MTKQEFGVALHVHHDILVEVLEGFSGRMGYIRANKPQKEVELRERLLQMVPDERLPSALQPLVVEAREAWTKLKLLYDDHLAKLKLLRDDNNANCQPLEDDYWSKRKPLDDDYDVKGKPLNDDYLAKRKALDDAIETHRAELEVLHKEVCLDCPWDGHTIFAKEEAR